MHECIRVEYQAFHVLLYRYDLNRCGRETAHMSRPGFSSAGDHYPARALNPDSPGANPVAFAVDSHGSSGYHPRM